MEVVGVKSVVAHVAQAVAYTSRYSSSWILSKNVRRDVFIRVHNNER